MLNNNKKIGFLVHPRNNQDVFNKYPLFKYLPNFLYKLITLYSPAIHVSKITGLKSVDGKEINGSVIGILLSPETMMENRELAKRSIIRAIKKAKDMNIGIIGLGALTASLSRGGLDILNEINGVGITTGRAYTTKTVTDYVKDVIKRFELNKKLIVVGVIGAAGSIGSSCSKLLHKYGIEHIYLIDLETKNSILIEHKNSIIKASESGHVHEKIIISNNINDIRKCDILISATSSPYAILTKDMMEPGQIIVNDAQPSDIHPNIIKERHDVLVIEGGVVSTPNISSNFKMGPVGKEENYCCLAEVLVLAHNNHFDNYALGHLDMNLIEKIEEKSMNLNFKIAKYQNFIQKYIPEEQINYVGGLLKNRIRNREGV